MKEEINWNKNKKIDVRIGTIIEVNDFLFVLFQFFAKLLLLCGRVAELVDALA